MTQESSRRYSAVSIALHWTIAALVLANVIAGGQMEEAQGAALETWMGRHKTIGISILILTLVRLGWRAAHPWPELPAAVPAWQRAAARATHIGFYVLLLAIPLLGWAALSAHGHEGGPQPIFGVVPWPDLPVPASEGLGEAFGGAHEVLVKALYGVIALHVAGALKHHLVDKDPVLHRMLPLIPRRKD